MKMVRFGHLKIVEGWQICTCIYVQVLGKARARALLCQQFFPFVIFHIVKEPVLPQFGDCILQDNPFCCGGHHDVTFNKAEHE